jgi:glycosyltransferase involved in cell wall biosynthesis
MTLPLLWHGAVFKPTGYADELRGMVMALERAGVPVILRPDVTQISAKFVDSLSSGDRALLSQSVARHTPSTPFMQLQHASLGSFAPTPQAAYAIGRTMFETNGLPADSVHRANALDELWVPSEFNRETFRNAGVTVPMHVISGGIDTEIFRPDVRPATLRGARGTVFLSVFEWRLRKGWDVLLRAWAEAFTPDDDVTLVMRTYPISQVDGLHNDDVITSRIDAFLRDECGGRTRADVAPIMVIGQSIDARHWPSLYAASAAFVLPTRGEGWGRPFMESMACGRPVIATNWSAHLEFMHARNSYLVDTNGLVPADSTEVTSYVGQHWADPSVSSLIEQLRRVHADRAEAAAIGRIARQDMVRDWQWSRAVSQINARLRDIDGQARTLTALPPKQGGAISIKVHGPAFSHSQRDGNTEMLAQLLDSGPDRMVQLVCSDDAVRPSRSGHRHATWQNRNRILEGTRVNITVLDDASAALVPTPPPRGAWIIDVGSALADGMPGHLVPTLRDLADEIWVPHELARDLCLAVGVASDRLRIVAPRIDVARFTPSGARIETEKQAATRILLTGTDRPHRWLAGAIDAYDTAFTAANDVILYCHLPPTHSGASTTWRDEFIAQVVSRDETMARVCVDTRSLNDDEMASLYRAVDVLLYPEATIGTGRTIREAMACGLPAIVDADIASEFRLPIDAVWTVTSDTEGLPVRDSVCLALRAASDRNDREIRRAATAKYAVTTPVDATSTAGIIDAVTARAQLTPRRIAGDQHPKDTDLFALADPRATVVLFHPRWAIDDTHAIVTAFAGTFSSADDVTLALCLDPAQDVTADDAAELVRVACAAAGRSPDTQPDILLVVDPLDATALSQLRAAAHCIIAGDSASAASAINAGKMVWSATDTSTWRHNVTPIAGVESVHTVAAPERSKIAVCALFRNSARYVDYFRAVISAQRRDDIDLAFSLVEGDSSDDTWRRLQAWASEDARVTLTKCDVEPVLDHDDRVRKWAALGNVAVEAALTTDCTHVLWCESDLTIPFDLIEQLVSSDRDIVAPAIFLGGMFYDTWGFRGLDSSRFTNAAPYHAEFKAHALVELMSVGSCVLFRREIFDAGVRFRGVYETGLLVGVCRDAAEHGFRTWMDSRIAIVHPTTLWRRQQYGLASVRVVGSDESRTAALEAAARSIVADIDIQLGALDVTTDHPIFAPVHSIIRMHTQGAPYRLSLGLGSEVKKQYTLTLQDAPDEMAA